MEPFQQKFSQVIEKAWNDEAFKQRLLQHPHDVLKEHGIDVPAEVNLRVLENTAQVHHFVLPAKPAALSESDLDNVAGGASAYPSQDVTAALGAGDNNGAGALFTPPADTSFGATSGLGVCGSDFNL